MPSGKWQRREPSPEAPKLVLSIPPILVSAKILFIKLVEEYPSGTSVQTEIPVLNGETNPLSSHNKLSFRLFISTILLGNRKAECLLKEEG